MSFCDSVAKVTLIAGAIGLLVGYWNYAKPTLHGVQFEAGLCNYTNLTVDRGEVSCSCGKSCTGYYPCFTLNGFFMVNETENSTQSDFNGTFYKDYAAVKQKKFLIIPDFRHSRRKFECLIVPSCSRKFDENSEKIYNYLNEVLFPYVNSTLYPGPSNRSTVIYNQSELVPCYGKDNLMYFDMKYAMWKAIVSLAVPGGVFALGMLITLTCSSREHKESVLSIIGLPFFIIAAILVGIAEILKLDDCFRACFRRLRNCCKSSPATTTRRHSVGLATEGDTEDFRSQRRHSLPSEAARPAVRLRENTGESGYSIGSLESDRTVYNEGFTPFAPSYQPEAAPYGGATAPRYDAPPPNYSAAAGGDAAMPPPSYNDVMTGGPGSGTVAAPHYNYSSS